ncbi:MAG: hypothetical protein HFG36_12160 [Eubacterium sp.]|jgi:hypothetical protein|nr:hypothetical protein [Eubacterium sp.]
MYSVTKRIGMIKQPRGGYINKKNLTVIQLDDGITLNEGENIHASLVGLAVDYMTRFMMGAEREEAFSISLKGAMTLDLFTGDKKQSSMKNAVKLLANIEGLDKKSITNACKLAGYDVCFRAGIMGYRPVEEINPDADTIENIMIMINRSLSFWKEYGPITKDGFTFEGGYTDTISTGDGDYLTKDTLWDFKVSKDEPKPKYTLQLLVYYIMGMHSIHKEFKSIKNLGIYNPRMNKVYTIDIGTISKLVIDEVSKEVIGY